ncbi:unnamed protein product [Macrosiphum euphorbiae]|uniref:Uncharacterized protein n=1 Tax=Macrosiphum euphorbiae TaxID=13131 RepID=A0AAV0WIE1_9HEMI|nr:unnamed protein product [Macrosiphum euphorbiae]
MCNHQRQIESKIQQKHDWNHFFNINYEKLRSCSTIELSVTYFKLLALKESFVTDYMEPSLEVTETLF